MVTPRILAQSMTGRALLSTTSGEKLAPLSQPMGMQTKTNRVLAARVFLCLAPVTCICFEL